VFARFEVVHLAGHQRFVIFSAPEELEELKADLSGGFGTVLNLFPVDLTSLEVIQVSLGNITGGDFIILGNRIGKSASGSETKGKSSDSGNLHDLMIE